MVYKRNYFDTVINVKTISTPAYDVGFQDQFILAVFFQTLLNTWLKPADEISTVLQRHHIFQITRVKNMLLSISCFTVEFLLTVSMQTDSLL